MKKETVTYYVYSKSDMDTLRSILNMAIEPHLRKEVLNISDDDLRMYNRFYYLETRIEGTVVQRFISAILMPVAGHIRDLRDDYKKERETAPETGNGLIANMREYYGHLIDNYTSQLRNIQEAQELLTKEETEN